MEAIRAGRRGAIVGCSPEWPVQDANVLFFNEWRAASRAAAAAERAVSETFMRYFSGTGDPPSAQQVEEARRRRSLADDLFSLAVRDWSDGKGDAGPQKE